MMVVWEFISAVGSEKKRVTYSEFPFKDLNFQVSEKCSLILPKPSFSDSNWDFSPFYFVFFPR